MSNVREIKCGKCREDSKEWWSQYGVYVVDETGMGIALCKVCFKKWLAEDETDVQTTPTEQQ